MKAAEMKKLGEQHAINGLMLTPFDCQEIDNKIFEYSRAECANIAEHMDREIARMRIYKKLRGAFNKGFTYKYAELVSIDA
jgi:hypothetical protein